MGPIDELLEQWLAAERDATAAESEAASAGTPAAELHSTALPLAARDLRSRADALFAEAHRIANPPTTPPQPDNRSHRAIATLTAMPAELELARRVEALRDELHSARMRNASLRRQSQVTRANAKDALLALREERELPRKARAVAPAAPGRAGEDGKAKPGDAAD